MKLNIISFFITMVIAQASNIYASSPKPVDYVNAKDFSGLWYEIARTYNSFEEVVSDDSITFSGADLQINGTYVFEDLSPVYFHVAQCYYRTKHGVSNFDYVAGAPTHTRFFSYNFCTNASEYSSTGSCNFSRLDNAKLTLRNAIASPARVGESIRIYALNYNVMKIKKGIAGIIFAD